MNVQRIVIHQIEKEQGVLEAHLTKSTSILQVDDDVVFLVEKLNDAFRKDEKVVKTEFKEEPQDFQNGVVDYIESIDDDSFYDLSVKSITALSNQLRASPLASGGYFVFIHYEHRNTDFLSVYLVRDTEEVMFKRGENQNFRVNKTTVVNTSKLAMACRIDIEKLQNEEPRYLHFTHKQISISEYFVNWIEASLADKSKEDTSTLIKMISNVELPRDPDTNEKYEEDKFRKNLFDYISSVGRVVKIREISENFWGNSEFLPDFIEENNLQINMEFQATPSLLRQLNRYVFKAGKVRLSFAKGDWTRGTIYRGDDNLVIIDSPEIRAEIDQQFGNDD